MELFEQYGIDIGYICIGIACLIVILFILVFFAIARQNSLIKKYRVFMGGDKDVMTMEQMFESRLGEIERLEKKNEKIVKKIMEMDNTILGTYQKMAIVKYDAFREMGGNLSFVLSMLDKNNSGFLLNSVHSRDACYTYIKDVIRGNVRVELSEEERQALQEAMDQD